VCAPITSGIVGIFSTNVFRLRDELWSANEKVIARILIHPNCFYFYYLYVCVKYETWVFTVCPVDPVMPGTPVGGRYVVVVG